MKIALASDHGGFELKEAVKEHLKAKGIETVDLGTNFKESVHYPEYGKKCGEYVVSGQADLGIVCCGTGIGISIAANKVKGVRCANVTSKEMAALAKEHNHANVLALGGRILTNEQAFEFIDTWLSTEEGHDRHDVRVAMLNEM